VERPCMVLAGGVFQDFARWPVVRQGDWAP
jgi:hypothetical protein